MANTVSSPISLSLFKKETKTFTLTVLDEDGLAVDMDAKTQKRFTVETRADPPIAKFAVSNASMAVSGAGNNIVAIPVSNVNTDLAPDIYHWRLWDDGDTEVFQHGTLEVVDTSESVT